MIKAIIFDADGVLIHRPKYFSEILHDEYGVPLEKSLEFFSGEFAECLIGKKDLKKVLPKYLKEWGWKKTLEELLTYWFERESKRDEKIIEYVKELKKKGFKIYIGTNNEKYRTDYLSNVLGLGKIAHKVYGSGVVGFAKPDHRFFKHILDEQKLQKEEVLFWDDDKENVKAARDFGINAEVYTNFIDFEKALKKYL